MDLVETAIFFYLPIQTGLELRKNRPWPDKIRRISVCVEPSVVRIVVTSMTNKV